MHGLSEHGDDPDGERGCVWLAQGTKGPVLDMLRGLLEERRDGEVLSLVAQLVARNSELERRVAQMASRTRTNEGVSEAQLKLFMGVLKSEGDEESGADAALADANESIASPSPVLTGPC